MKLPRLLWVLPVILIFFAGARLSHPAAAKCSLNCNFTGCVNDCGQYEGDPSFTLVAWSALNTFPVCMDNDHNGQPHCAKIQAQTFKVLCSVCGEWQHTCQKVTGGCANNVPVQPLTQCIPAIQ